MERQICYVAGQVLFGCVEKWKKKESSMGEIVSNFTLSCLPFASMLVFLEPDATQHWAVGGGAQRGSVIFVLASHSLLLVMFGNEWYSECVLIFSPPHHCYVQRACKNEHLAKKTILISEGSALDLWAPISTQVWIGDWLGRAFSAVIHGAGRGGASPGAGASA